MMNNEDFAAIPCHEYSGDRQHKKPLVSILMLAYKHEDFICQAIESIVSQQCNFVIELLIGEDCSKDQTRSICLSYVDKFPDVIRLYTAEVNVGMHRNFARIWYRARGKFLAMCEGDDFWCDEKKLQKQVDWMQKHPDAAMCGTFTRKIEQDDNQDWVESGLVRPAEIKKNYTLRDLIPGYTFHFSSILLRKQGIRFPSWFWDVYCVDRPLYLLCAEQGQVGCLPEVTSVYRLHQGGIWSPQHVQDKATQGIDLFEHVNEYFHHQYNSLIRRTLGEILWYYMSEALEQNDKATAKELLGKSLRYQLPRFSIRRLRSAVGCVARLYVPALFRRG